MRITREVGGISGVPYVMISIIHPEDRNSNVLGPFQGYVSLELALKGVFEDYSAKRIPPPGRTMHYMAYPPGKNPGVLNEFVINQPGRITLLYNERKGVYTITAEGDTVYSADSDSIAKTLQQFDRILNEKEGKF